MANGVISSPNQDSLTLVLALLGIACAIPILFYTLQCAAKCMRWGIDLALKAALALLVVALAMVAWQALASPWLKEAFQIDHETPASGETGGFPIYQGNPKKSDQANFISLALETKHGNPMHYKIPKWSHDVDGGGPWVRLVKGVGNFDTTQAMVGLVTDLAWRGMTSLASVPFSLASRASNAILKATVGTAPQPDSLCGSACAETHSDCPQGIRCMCLASDVNMSLTDRLWGTFGMQEKSGRVMGTETRPCLSSMGDKIGLCECQPADHASDVNTQ